MLYYDAGTEKRVTENVPKHLIRGGYFKEIMSIRAVPDLICSGYAEKNARMPIGVLAAGAVRAVSKPETGVSGFLQDFSQSLIESVKAATSAVQKSVHHSQARASEAEAKLTTGALLPPHGMARKGTFRAGEGAACAGNQTPDGFAKVEFRRVCKRRIAGTQARAFVRTGDAPGRA